MLYREYLTGQSFIELKTAHDAIIAVVAAIPDAALEWQPSSDEWSLKQTIGHLTHSNDFYVMIIDEVRANNFNSLLLHLELPGFRRMEQSDAEVAQCTALSAILDCFERAFERMIAALQATTTDELDRPFLITYSWNSDSEGGTTTLRQRVIETAVNHLREHQTQLTVTLTRWQTAHNS